MLVAVGGCPKPRFGNSGWQFPKAGTLREIECAANHFAPQSGYGRQASTTRCALLGLIIYSCVSEYPLAELGVFLGYRILSCDTRT